jgi:hypothetical protein
MKRLKSMWCGIVVLLLAISANAQASPQDWEQAVREFSEPRDGEVIVEQLPTRLGGLGSDTAFRDYVGRPIWSQTAENLLISEPAVVGSIEWYGFYGGYEQSHNPPTGDETMRIRFYAARPDDSLPGDVLYEQNFLNPSRTATGANVVCDVLAPEFFYAVDLPSPLSLAAGTPYWLEIVQINDLESHFRWEAGYGLIPEHATRWTSLPEWQFNTGSLAFRLIVPEPQGFVLIMAGSVLMSHKRSGRRHV